MAIPVTAYCTHRVPPEIHFPHESLVSRDRSDSALLSHLEDAINYILQGGEREMTASLYGVFRHLQRVQVQFQFTVEGENVEAIAPWAWQTNAILLLPDGPERTQERIRIGYFSDDAASGVDYAALREANTRLWQVVFGEDISPVERMQAGRHSPAFDGGILTPVLETTTRDFHAWMANRLLNH